MEEIALASRLILGLVFVRAGLTKLTHGAVFAQAVSNYRLVPEWASQPIARTLPMAEVLVGGLLLLGVAQTASSLVVAGLLGVFAFAVSVNLVRGRSIDCGCLGSGAPSPITWWTVCRNLVLILAALVIAGSPRTALSFQMPWELPVRSSLAAGEAFAIVMAVIATILTERLIMESFRIRRSILPFAEETRRDRSPV
ncbi:MAG: DoxX family membrane protein [Actinobacteria bacterium]|nr:DoxX family membrane protein [Actinomycetota bacterium]